MGSDFFRDLWSSITSGKVWRGDICNRAKDGSLFWVDSVIVPFIDSDGLPVRYIAITSVITDRKAAENEILQAHQRLEMAEDIGHIGSFECDANRQSFRCSKGLNGLLKRPDEIELTYQAFSELIEVSDRNILEPAIDQSITTKQPFSCSFRMNLKDGPQVFLF